MRGEASTYGFEGLNDITFSTKYQRCKHRHVLDHANASGRLYKAYLSPIPHRQQQ
jgi:hypothetical protein